MDAISKSAEINARWLSSSSNPGLRGLRWRLLFVDDDKHNCDDVAASCGGGGGRGSVASGGGVARGESFIKC